MGFKSAGHFLQGCQFLLGDHFLLTVGDHGVTLGCFRQPEAECRIALRRDAVGSFPGRGLISRPRARLRPWARSPSGEGGVGVVAGVAISAGEAEAKFVGENAFGALDVVIFAGVVETAYGPMIYTHHCMNIWSFGQFGGVEGEVYSEDFVVGAVEDAVDSGQVLVGVGVPESRFEFELFAFAGCGQDE